MTKIGLSVPFIVILAHSLAIPAMEVNKDPLKNSASTSTNNDGVTSKGERIARTNLKKIMNSTQSGIHCTSCDVTISHATRDEIFKHITTKHADYIPKGKTQKICPVCMSSWENRSTLRRHLMKYSEIREHQCPTCKTLLKSQDAVRRHVRAHKLQFLLPSDGKPLTYYFHMKMKDVARLLNPENSFNRKWMEDVLKTELFPKPNRGKFRKGENMQNLLSLKSMLSSSWNAENSINCPFPTFLATTSASAPSPNPTNSPERNFSEFPHTSSLSERDKSLNFPESSSWNASTFPISQNAATFESVPFQGSPSTALSASLDHNRPYPITLPDRYFSSNSTYSPDSAPNSSNSAISQDMRFQALYSYSSPAIPNTLPIDHTITSQTLYSYSNSMNALDSSLNSSELPNFINAASSFLRHNITLSDPHFPSHPVNFPHSSSTSPVSSKIATGNVTFQASFPFSEIPNPPSFVFAHTIPLPESQISSNTPNLTPPEIRPQTAPNHETKTLEWLRAHLEINDD